MSINRIHLVLANGDKIVKCSYISEFSTSLSIREGIVEKSIIKVSLTVSMSNEQWYYFVQNVCIFSLPAGHRIQSSTALLWTFNVLCGHICCSIALFFRVNIVFVHTQIVLFRNEIWKNLSLCLQRVSLLWSVVAEAVFYQDASAVCPSL